MSDIKIQPSGSGTAVVTLTAPTTNTARTITFPDATGTLLNSGSTLDATKLSGNLPAISAANLTAIPAANITGTLPALAATNLTSIPAANITGTLPAISGANLTGLTSVQMPTGSVLQVVQGTNSYTAQGGSFLQASNSTSWNAVALSAAITPSSTSSKILITVQTNNNRGGHCEYTIYGGGSNLGGSTYGMVRFTGAGSGWDTSVNLIHLHSPSTTSAITYQLYAKAEAGIMYTGGDGDMLSHIILQEIAG